MTALTKQDLTDALATVATKQDLTDALDSTRQDLTDSIATTKQDLIKEVRTAVTASEQYIVGEVGKQLRVIADSMVTKGDLKEGLIASERRQSMRMERALTKHVVTWHAAQLG